MRKRTGLLFAALVLSTEAAAQTCEYPIADLAACMKRTPRAGHQATVSKPPCGPDGSAVGSIAPQGFGEASFEAACGGHDICYESCNAVKTTCDATFANQMEASCRAAYPYPALSSSEDENWTRRGTCLARARLYARLVGGAGQAAYEAAQKVACECCKPAYEGSIQFRFEAPGVNTTGSASLTWTQFEADAVVSRYLPSGTITAMVAYDACDGAQVIVPIATSNPASPAETLVVYSPSNPALARRYHFTFSGGGSFTLNCGSPRMPVTFPGSSIVVFVGPCGGGPMPSYVDESRLEGNAQCPQQRLTSASWSFHLP